MQQQFLNVLMRSGFEEKKAKHCATIFAENSRDGVYSHGLNRFPVFIRAVKEGLVNPAAEPQVVGSTGSIEHWDGQLGPGMYIASLAMGRAMELARENGLGAVTVRNSNHWMRGGTYGWHAAEGGCIGICASNTIANMPPWGGRDPRLGNNPFIIAVPRKEGPVVLDMALSQFSYGKLQEYSFSKKQLPVAGGYDEEGQLTTDPQKIRSSKRTLPVGFWKGSGLSLMLDLLTAALSGGRSVGDITSGEKEYGLSQFFLCISATHLQPDIVEEIIAYAKSSRPVDDRSSITYPGERTLLTRKQNEQEGIPVNEEIWKEVLSL